MGRRSWTAPVVVIVALASFTAAGCGTDEPTASPVGSSASSASSASAATASSTSGAPMTSMAPTRIADETGLGECPQRMPGDLLAEDEAVVRFSPQAVCLGYLTVNEGTPIQWTNLDSASHTVSIVDDDEQPVESFEVAPGATHVSSTPAVGIYRFRTTAIESFTGSIEVQAR